MATCLGVLTLLMAMLLPYSCHARPLSPHGEEDAVTILSSSVPSNWPDTVSLPSSQEPEFPKEPVSEACQNRTFTRYVPVQTTDELRVSEQDIPGAAVAATLVLATPAFKYQPAWTAWLGCMEIGNAASLHATVS